MYTTSCFIGKNTQSLRDSLEKMGYTLANHYSIDSECLATTCGLGVYFSISKKEFYSNNPYITYNCNGRIDCGENEELFLALASLRNDTDKGQWFVFDETVITDDNQIRTMGSMFKLGEYKFDNTIKTHKATVEELIEKLKI